MDKKYNHRLYEEKIYHHWQEKKFFHYPKNFSQDLKFSLVMPPPNANDPLHLGHVMFASVEDILIRFHRMQQKDVVWFPGADHAGIETQFIFEKKLQKKDQSRFQFDRQTLYQMILNYVQDNIVTMKKQLKKIGVSCDWEKFLFTLNPKIINFVYQAFAQLHQDKLIYRDFKLVNFCPKCGTAFSDLEINRKTATTPLYYLKYGPFVLATTRPETKFGDTAVAVNPQDKRYQKYIGQEIEIDGLLGKLKLKVIADDYVDVNFGTGVVKITPFHDHNDYDIYCRHKNEMPQPKQIIDFSGRLNKLTGPYCGLKVKIAREKIVADLHQKNLIVKIDQKYQNNLAICYRCQNIIEPLPMPQFFIKVKPLTKPIIEKIKNKEIKIYGKGYNKILLNWLNNLKDWNITRQITWGIKLPIVYDVKDNPNLIVTFLDKNNQRQTGQIQNLLKKYSLSKIKQKLQDVQAPINAKYLVKTKTNENEISETACLDTWFSSGLWPLIHGLNWEKFKNLNEKKDKNFKEKISSCLNYYPQNLMETGYDILPFWVMRMLMLGFYFTDKLPFKNIYLHGLIRDQKGQKMSKSKGNVIDPLTIIDKYGADALRFALIIRSSAGLDKSIAENDFISARNFTNKIWNAGRFIILQLTEQKINTFKINLANKKFNSTEKKVLNKLNQIIKIITKNLVNYKLGLASDVLYNEFWHWFCDQIINDYKEKHISLAVLLVVFINFLKMLHPFLPFLTTAIWQELGKIVIYETDLMVATWPEKVVKKN